MVGQRRDGELVLRKQSTPPTPPTGYAAVYPKADGLWYGLTDAGAEALLGGGGTPTAPAGTVMAFATASIPTGWLACDGSPYLASTYPELFAALGGLSSPWGLLDGGATFRVPDLQGRTIICEGLGEDLTLRSLAQKIGAETHTLTVGQMPAHQHDTSALRAQRSPVAGGSNIAGRASSQSNQGTTTHDITINGLVDSTGGGNAHNNMQPSIVLRYGICTGQVAMDGNTLTKSLLTAKGSLITATAAGVPAESVAGGEGLTPVYRSAAPNGLVWESPTVGNRTFALLANPGAATAQRDGFPADYTLTATAADADDARGPWVRHTTAATNPSHSGVVPAAYTYARPGWVPDVEFVVSTEATITLMRIFAGLTSALPDGATIPTTLHGAYFKYETNGGVTTWQCCTAAGGAPTVTTATGVTVAANTRYKLRIEFVGSLGANPTSVRFYINDVLVATHTLTLPAANQTLSPIMRVSTLTAAARTFLWGKMIMAAN